MKTEHLDHHGNQHPIEDLGVRFSDLLGEIPIECGPGWYAPLLDLFTNLVVAGVRGNQEPANYITFTADFIRLPRPKEPTILHVKEKLGGLRVYLSASTPEIDRAISWAEDVCAETCDRCGRAGRLRHLGGLLATRCDAHLDRD